MIFFVMNQNINAAIISIAENMLQIFLNKSILKPISLLTPILVMLI